MFSLAWDPRALEVLFPASPDLDGWFVVIGLCLNIPIVVAPIVLWRVFRALYPPPIRLRPKGWRRVALWLAILPSAALAPLIVGGPPNLLLFLFPPMLVLNALVSLVAVWVASKMTDAGLRIVSRARAGTRRTAAP